MCYEYTCTEYDPFSFQTHRSWGGGGEQAITEEGGVEGIKPLVL
jgi:hypothetical protein